MRIYGQWQVEQATPRDSFAETKVSWKGDNRDVALSWESGDLGYNSCPDIC